MNVFINVAFIINIIVIINTDQQISFNDHPIIQFYCDIDDYFNPGMAWTQTSHS